MPMSERRCLCRRRSRRRPQLSMSPRFQRSHVRRNLKTIQANRYLQLHARHTANWITVVIDSRRDIRVHTQKTIVRIILRVPKTQSNILVFCCYSGKGAVLGSLTNSQSVSFRQGTNVEFGPTAFNNGPGGGVNNTVCH